MADNRFTTTTAAAAGGRLPRRPDSAPEFQAYSIFENPGPKLTTNPPYHLQQPQHNKKRAGKDKKFTGRDSTPRSSEKGEGFGLIKRITSWSFDILVYNELNTDRTFENVCFTILRTFGVDVTLEVDESTLRAWLHLVEHAYERENPYHNALHAADVTQAVACFLRTPRVKDLLDSYDIATCLVAAIIHDIHHPGMVNAALKRMGHPLSFAFKQPYLERHHVDIAFDLTEANPEANIFRRLTLGQRRWIKKGLTELVYATDMDQHMSFHSELKKLIAEASSPSAVLDVRRLKNSKSTLVVKKMLLKAGDISNTMRRTETFLGWAERICEEFFRQGEIEISRGLPPTLPDFVRDVCSVPKTQCAFLNYIKPFAETVSGFLEMSELVQNLRQNLQFFQHLQDNGVRSLEQVKLASKNGLGASLSRGRPGGACTCRCEHDLYRPQNLIISVIRA